jgi:hypothetical protein
MPVMIRSKTCRFAKIANAIMKKDQPKAQKRNLKPAVDVGGTGAFGKYLTGSVK